MKQCFRHVEINDIWIQLTKTPQFSNVTKNFKLFYQPKSSFESFLSHKQVAPSCTSLSSLESTTLAIFISKAQLNQTLAHSTSNMYCSALVVCSEKARTGQQRVFYAQKCCLKARCIMSKKPKRFYSWFCAFVG